MKRIDFIRNSSVFALSALAFQATASVFQSSKIRVGVIGVNGMGWSNLNAILKINQVECIAICDIDDRVLKKRVDELKQRNINVKTYTDYKELLQNKNIDAVIIGTPDHWHCLQMVDALRAGKHVYVEKPIGNSIKECEIILKAAAKSNNIVQVGQWQRSMQHFEDAVNYVQSGKLGKIRLVKAWNYQGSKKSIGNKINTETPTGVDYSKWLGPALKRPYNENRFHFTFRWFWDYAGGLMTDWGVHLLDYALIGMQVSNPKSIMAAGGKFAFPDDDAETPDTMTAIYEFDNFNLQWEHAVGINLGPYNRNHGVAFIGNNGTLVLNRSGWEVLPEGTNIEAVPLQKSQDNGLDKHMQNFVEAIIKKDKSILKAPIEAGAHIAILSQMGNIAYRTGKKIYWNKDSKKFNEDEANKFLAATYHNGYKLPEV